MNIARSALAFPQRPADVLDQLQSSDAVRRFVWILVVTSVALGIPSWFVQLGGPVEAFGYTWQLSTGDRMVLGLLGLPGWWIGALLLSLSCRILGGSGSVWGTAAVVAGSYVPGLLWSPFGTALIALGVASGGKLGIGTVFSSIGYLIGGGIWLWCVMIEVKALQHLHGFTTGRAVGALSLSSVFSLPVGLLWLALMVVLGIT